MKSITKKLLLIFIFTSILYFQANAATITVSTDLSALTSDCSGNVCTVSSGSDAIINLLGGIIKYATFIVGLAAVLFIIVNGIMYSMGGMDQSMKEESKKRIVKTLIGIIFLLMTGTILNLIAPWIYKM